MCELPEFLEVRTNIPFTGNEFNDAKEIGCFSMKSQNERMEVQYDDTMKKYYFKRQFSRGDNFDLNEGYDVNFKMNPFTDEKLEDILNWIMNEKKFQHVMSKDCIDFVTSRGTIQKLLCTPFCTGERKTNWRIYASKFRNTIYFIAVDSEKKYAEERNPTEGSRRRNYWGQKFEQYMTTSDPKVEPDLTTKCYESGYFCIIATNRIGNHTLLFRAEMDAQKQPFKHPSDTSEYIEMKTCKYGELTKPYSNKTLYLWAQCTIAGVKDCVCGFRNDSGILTGISEYKVEELPWFQRNKYRQWSPKACFNFCNYFLTFLKENLIDDYKSVFRFDFTGGNKISFCQEKDEKILPNEYVENFLRKESVSQSESHREKKEENERKTM